MKTSAWRECKLGDVITLKRGYDLPHQQRKPGPFPIVSSSGVTDHHAEAKVQGPGVVTGRYGTLGEVFFVEGEFWPLNTALYVRDFKGNDPRFVSYFLRGLNFGNQNAAGAVPGVNRNHLHAMDVRVPTPTVQRRIAETLSAYDDLIENCERRIRVLDEMARALYREWFVLFRYPGHEKVPLVDSALGRIPKGWECGHLEDLLVLQRGFDLPKGQREEGTVPIIAATGVNGFHSVAKVKGPGVVTGRSGSIGHVLYVQEDFWPLNTSLWVKEFPKSEPLFAYFVLAGLNLAQFNVGAAVPTLNRNDVHGLDVLIPPRALQIHFQRHADSWMRHKRLLQRSAENFRKGRDLLLPRLLSGELNVEAPA